MTEFENVLSWDYETLLSQCTEKWTIPRFRADQICQWIYQKKVFQFSEMTNLSKDLRKFLEEEAAILPPYLIRKEKSTLDATEKFLWGLLDGENVESVLLSHGTHMTACISTQVGCPLKCAFCATGQSGFVRNLETAEITGQLLAMEKHTGKDIQNIVFMGMGEPLLNTENLFRSIRILNNPKMRKLGARHMTVSTAGIAPGIIALADLEIPVRLSVSLHAPNDSLRKKIMPVNQTYPLSRLMESLKIYQERTGERITFEYLMLKDLNDLPEHAYELGALLSGLNSYINLIPYNPVDKRFARSTKSQVKAFMEILKDLGLEAEVRKEKGTDINAACGQLRRNISSRP
ncbi:MAG TPA: 23S rRNA (adenine(2503)-C(2))-methyltransferase RlmN [Synergistales bacterium]|nr:23S rRNA (adenine(2503)-C(2))-methyltransferase RlmN [Synergistales bacterium]